MIFEFTNLSKAWTQYKDCSIAEKAFVLLVIMFWCSGLLGFVKSVIERLPIVSSISSFFIPISILFLVLVSLSYIIRHIRYYDIMFYLGIVIIYALNYNLYPNNTESLNRYAYSFIICALPLYFIGKAINPSKISSILFIVSVFCVIITSFYYLVFTHADDYSGSSQMDEESHNMVAAYQVLPSVLYIIYCFLQEKGLISGIVSILGFVLVSSFGTRGALMCLILFLLFVLIFTKKYKYPIISYSIICLIGVFVLFFLTDILIFMIYVTEQLNMSSRVFEMALDEVFFGGEASGDERLFFAEKLGRVMQQDGNFLGYGIAASFNYIGSYPHNFLWELRFSFGNFVGFSIFIGIIVILIRKFFKVRSEFERVFLVLLFCKSFIKLFMSGTMLDEPWLYFMIGYSMIARDSENQELCAHNSNLNN